MENFFSWMTKLIPKEEVIIWFNVHNIHYEKVELFGDIFISLYRIIDKTYLGEDTGETKIFLSVDDVNSHFEWAWMTLLNNFNRENININLEGDHKEYVREFFIDTYYFPPQKNIKDTLDEFLLDTFDYKKSFTKSDLDILTEIYHLFNKNLN